MKLSWWILGAAALVVAVAATGCGRARPPAGGRAAAQAAAVLLPEWAPKDPSPEFLRATKVLKPLPAEFWAQVPASSTAERALLTRMVMTYPAAWELFGSLTDEQATRFLAKAHSAVPEGTDKGLYLPIRSFAPSQRALLDKYFEAFRKAAKGVATQGIPAAAEDRLLMLYQSGAKQDLSNVDLGFTMIGKAVNITFLIHAGKQASFGIPIATL